MHGGASNVPEPRTREDGPDYSPSPDVGPAVIFPLPRDREVAATEWGAFSPLRAIESDPSPTPESTAERRRYLARRLSRPEIGGAAIEVHEPASVAFLPRPGPERTL